MREYELVVLYDLGVAEAGGGEAAVEQVRSLIESRGGRLLRVDHWGRRRMAYPINHAIDADYVVARLEMEAEGVAPIEAVLRIDERVYRHMIVRADELPEPAPPREARQQPTVASEPAPTPLAAAPPAAAPVTEPVPEATQETATEPEEEETAAPAEPPAAEAVTEPAADGPPTGDSE